MVVQSFLYLLVCLNRTELFPRGHSKTSTPPSREITASPVNGLMVSLRICTLKKERDWIIPLLLGLPAQPGESTSIAAGLRTGGS